MTEQQMRAALQLLEVMERVSREHFSAAWFDGLEALILRRINGEAWTEENFHIDTACCPDPIGLLGADIPDLVKESGGIWAWAEDEGPVFRDVIRVDGQSVMVEPDPWPNGLWITPPVSSATEAK